MSDYVAVQDAKNVVEETGGVGGLEGNRQPEAGDKEPDKLESKMDNEKAAWNLTPTCEQSDAFKLLSIFPAEVWEKIYNKLRTECRDLANLSNGSYFWEDHLSASKTCWLFKMVCPILCTYLDKRSVLTCRQVCQDWKASVDEFLPNWRFLDPLTPSKNGYYVNFPGAHAQNPEEMTFKQLCRGINLNGSEAPLEFDRCSSFNRIEDLVIFRSLWDGNSTGNPFLSGTFKAIQLDQDDASVLHENFWPEVIAILKQHGKRIRQLTLFFEMSYDSLWPEKNYVRDMLMEVPNLRELTINFGCVDPPDHRAMRTWRRRLANFPFPNLPHLHSINIDPDMNSSAGIFYFHRQNTFPGPYYRQLTKLEYNSEYDFQELLRQPHPFPNLVDICLTIHSLADLKTVGVLESSLKRVILTIEHPGICVKDVMQVFGKFGSTLTVLKLVFFNQAPCNQHRVRDDPGPPYTPQQSVVSFPQLKIIEVDFHKHPAKESFFYDLLRISPSLPPFRLKVTCPQDELAIPFFLPYPDDLLALKVHGKVERMYESRIWELIPSLAEYRFEGEHEWLGKSVRKTYTREGYEEWKRLQVFEKRKLYVACRTYRRRVMERKASEF